MNWKPLGKFVLVQPDESPEPLAGGLLVAGASALAVGYVEDVGPEVVSIRVGDKVIFDRGVGRLLKDHGAQLLLVNEAQLLARS